MRSRCHKIKRRWSRWIALLLLAGNTFAVPTAQGQLYENDSRRLGGGKMDIAEPPSIAGPEFSGLTDRQAVIDLEQFAPISAAN
ncbi:MAG: hypothetical protein ACM3TN_23870 [Alphaproteobacteria bacterium]